jgi:hypothetical protein
MSGVENKRSIPELHSAFRRLLLTNASNMFQLLVYRGFARDVSRQWAASSGQLAAGSGQRAASSPSRYRDVDLMPAPDPIDLHPLHPLPLALRLAGGGRVSNECDPMDRRLDLRAIFAGEETGINLLQEQLNAIPDIPHLVPAVPPIANDPRKSTRKRAAVVKAWVGPAKCCKKLRCCDKFSFAALSKIIAIAAPWDTACVHHSAENRKAWARGRITGGEEAELGKRTRKFFLDLPALWEQDGYHSPFELDVGNSGVCVCKPFFLFATKMSNNLISAAALDAGAHAGMRPVRMGARKEPTKKARVQDWVVELGSQYQQSPDSTLSIVPFVDRR